MPSASEINQFRRYIGDFKPTPAVDVTVVDSYLDDAARQISSTHGTLTTVVDFDLLAASYKSEVIILAAINYWWNRAAENLEKHNITVGQASVDAGARYDRAMQMIERLETLYSRVAVLGTEIMISNLSRWSKTSLYRVGGQREEDLFNG